MRDGVSFSPDTRKALALIAYLAVTRQRQSRDTLAALLWPDYDQTHARATLRRTLSALNKVLSGGELSVNRETIGLNPEHAFWLDINEFKACLEQCHQHAHPPTTTCESCLEPLGRAADLYTNDFMAGWSLQDSSVFDDWQFYQADSLRRDLASILERLVLCYMDRTKFNTAIPYARRLLALDRLHEPAHRYLIQIYAWSGQRSSALHQYQECVKILNEELGVSPLEATTRIYHEIKENRFAPPALAKTSLSPAPEPSSPATAASYLLVGRQSEWEALTSLYTSAAPTPHIIALEGEAGIGKTRLAEEFVAYARSRGALTVTVRCYEGEIDLAYGPIATGLRTAISQQQSTRWYTSIAPHWLSEVTRLLPELVTLRPDLPEPPPLDNPGAQSRFFEGLRQVWLQLCASPSSAHPGIIFFDDIHWADETSLEFLSYLARRLAETSICLLLTWRGNQRPTVQRLRRLLTEARQKGKAQLLTLARLDQAAVEQLLSQVATTGSNRPPYIAQRLYQETEGVPLFLTEYLTAMATGVLKTEDKDWSLPGGVRDLLTSRLAVAGETGKQLLSAAATIGRSFDFDTLRETSGRSEEETVTGLEELIGLGLIEELHLNEASPIYDFGHEKLRSLVYTNLTLARRRLLHRRAAEVLATRLRGRGSLAGQIAHHYQSAGNMEAAIRYFLQAAEHARALYAHTESLSHFCTALDLGLPNSAYLQETIGDLHTFLGDYEAALAAYLSAERYSDTTDVQARLKHKQGHIYERRGRWEEAEKLFAESLRLIELPAEQARVYTDWSLSAHHNGQIERASQLARLALELAEEANDTLALALAHNMLGILANHTGEVGEAYTHLERSLALAEELQNTSMRAAALNNLALACKASGDLQRAITLTQTALALCHAQGDRHREAALHSNLADLFHELDQTAEAMEQLKAAARIYSEIDAGSGTMQPAIWKLVEW